MRMSRQFAVRSVLAVVGVLMALAIWSQTAGAQGAELPPGFAETVVAADIQNPVGMEVDPDGRLFVLAGFSRRIEIYDDNGFVNEFLELPQAIRIGSGLMGLEFAPDFATSGDVYIAYITNSDVVDGPTRFRISSFSSDGSVADPASENVLFEVEDPNPDQQLHQGGDLGIGADGKLYWALGDRVQGRTVSQPFNSLFGKVLRLNLDGSIPTDNPFYDTLSGDFRAIIANGLRNPYRMERQESTGDLFLSEVGNFDWEELNRIESEANYGWPLVEGPANDPRYVDGVFSINHDPDMCAITGGAFYETADSQFPAEYAGDFFYGDHCFGWIAHYDMDTGVDTRCMAGADRLVEVKVNPVTGSVYYLDREYQGDTTGRSGGIGRIDFVGDDIDLAITRQPASVSASVNEVVQFDVLVTGEGPFEFQWSKDNVEIAGATESILSFEAAAADDGAVFSVEVTDANDNSVQSNGAVLTVIANNAPVPVITSPDVDLLYTAGVEYEFAGEATDAEDGPLPASALSWEIVFHHDDHTHPFIPELDGVASGTFTPPIDDETAPNVWYRIYLTATDSNGGSATVVQDVFPVQAEVTLETNPPGLTVFLDGTPMTTPVTFTSVAGVSRALRVNLTQQVGGQTYTFDNWSDGGTRIHTISGPQVDTTYTATFTADGQGGDAAPTVEIDEPGSGDTVGAPITVSGTAADDTGINLVQVVIRENGTDNYWNGSQFVNGWRANRATLSNRFGTATDWSYEFSPPDDVEVKVVVKARDMEPKEGPREDVTFLALAEEAPNAVLPIAQIDRPAGGTTQGAPIAISGTASAELGVKHVQVIIREVGTDNYWNGTDFVAGWRSIFAPLADPLATESDWSYNFSPPEDVDVRLAAKARDNEGDEGPVDFAFFSALASDGPANVVAAGN